uniref:Uncharacterized protein n=1 Tax=Hordeum vulgare subsp. vulgare TaxID=112509 RepID=A0A8I6X8C3_HORVV
MWHYSGPEDSTRSHPEEVDKDTVAKWIRNITSPCDNPLGSKRVLPYSFQNPPNNVTWTNMYSPVPNGAQLEVKEGSMEGSAESDYVEDNEETKDDSEESEDEVSSPSRVEPQSKQRHNPADTPNKTLASSGRSTKRVRGASNESAENSAKLLKPSKSKPQKALPRMRISVPVASTAATSVMSPPREDGYLMDVDTADATTSQ